MNIRLSVAERYKEAMARMDEGFCEWLRVMPDVQALIDIAVEKIDSVVCSPMFPGSLPEIKLRAFGDEQESAVYRALDEFCAEFGYSKMRSGWCESADGEHLRMEKVEWQGPSKTFFVKVILIDED